MVALLGGGGLAAGGFARAAEHAPATIRIDDRAAGAPIDPFIYGSNELGTMDGEGPSVDFDRRAGVTVRRLGGNLMTAYNWRDNAANSGKDYQHANSDALLRFLDVPKEDRDRPGEVVEIFLANSRKIGARSLLTLPLAGYVAADFNGAVAPNEAAPSPRFAAVDWSEREEAGGAVNIPAFVARLVAEHGGAASGGVRGYYLDNEPGLWTRTHPRIVKSPPTIKSFIEKSLRAAAAIKKIDSGAWVLGPTSWGAPEFLTFQNAPDWADYKAHGSFLAAYLAAFRAESERRGLRLLDCLDVHWYPQIGSGDLYRNENPALAPAVLDAPRSLDDATYCEKSWVADTLGCGTGSGLPLPLLPSLRRIVEKNFPGVGLSIGEYNFGGPGQLSSGLAVADALGRFGRAGVKIAAHWGDLAGWIGEAFRLYRMKDADGRLFGAHSLPVESNAGPGLSLFSAHGEKGEIDLIAINKTAQPVAFDLRCGSNRPLALRATLGFDASRRSCRAIDGQGSEPSALLRLVTPEFSARRYALNAE